MLACNTCNKFLIFRKTGVTDDDILQLKKLKDRPISYLVETPAAASTTPSVQTPLGVHLIGSALSYHVCCTSNSLIYKIYIFVF